jgi:FKBP-type peptidyl-prolyl cis-trans isomerase FkpA
VPNLFRLSFIACALLLAACSQPEPEAAAAVVDAAPAVNLMDEQQKFSYAIGISAFKNIEEGLIGIEGTEIELDKDTVLKGFSDSLRGASELNNQGLRAAITQFQARASEVQQAKVQAEAEVHGKEGLAYLAQNTSQAGVVTLASGLQYVVIEPGEGQSPSSAETTVKVHYKGTLIDGTQFDSTYDRNKPATFPLSGVIEGWKEGVQLMNEGAKWRFFIPANLAYGPTPTASIPANSTLIFEVELLEVID